MIGFEIWRGDIARAAVDAVVNSANGSLYDRGGGTDLAIRMAGGRAIERDCQLLRATTLRSGLADGQAVATTAGELPARWVIHTAAPVYSFAWDRSRTLARCYRNCLLVADRLRARTIAFPPLAAGSRGWPLFEAADIAVRALIGARSAVDRVILVARDAAAEAAFAAAVGGDLGQWEELSNDDWLGPLKGERGRQTAQAEFDPAAWA
ncbi:MAG: macro domain-containing protein [Bifidobacteriaceae bacterium]|jgi:O-acetyl-ADP-ribose deacetylase (regulator of RNase III)|nr:macro domain-containing protein [Bifidobacteriaceae bacterium]